ncbi:dsRBD fold-containing protein [Streptomyces sp. NPDC046821]|uniref:dsRBD fold-containing protein n=1 Tax=Streptomyces sp. NPDC046821 TaxID=3154702 RepID=UPI0033CF74D9
MSHVAEWKVRLYVSEDDRTTKARVEVDTGTNRLTGHSSARCAPQDKDVPEIGDELAVGRAMENLGEQLKRTAYGDMQALGSPTQEESLKPYSGWLDIAAT